VVGTVAANNRISLRRFSEICKPPRKLSINSADRGILRLLQKNGKIAVVLPDANQIISSVV
jgi:hypothetical protein